MKPYLIAEIGINHNGKIDIAKKLIDMAVECKWDAVKFQKRDIDTVYTKEFLLSPRESPWGKTQREQKEGLEFSKKEYDIIDRYCKKKEIDWFASAWDLDSLDFLKQYNLKYNKVASAMLTNNSFIDAVAREGKHTFISTGLSNIYDIDNAHNIFLTYGCPHTIMHCVGEYPCPSDRLNLSVINTLKGRYGVDIGYSGHSPGTMDAIIARVLGATTIEKHITLDRSMYGSDQSASIEKAGMEVIRKHIDSIDSMLGSSNKQITEKEKQIADKLRYW